MTISTNPNFIATQELELLAEFARNLTVQDRWNKTDAHPVWGNRLVHATSLVEPHLGYGTEEDLQALRVLVDVRKRIKRHIVSIRGLQEPLYADTLQIVRWQPGHEQLPHADAENLNGTPHPFPWRAYASIIYLNSDYDGGTIYFPNQGLELRPEPGTMVTFPGTKEYLHGVTKIRSGERHTVASFWTLDQARQDALPI